MQLKLIISRVGQKMRMLNIHYCVLFSSVAWLGLALPKVWHSCGRKCWPQIYQTSSWLCSIGKRSSLIVVRLRF